MSPPRPVLLSLMAWALGSLVGCRGCPASHNHSDASVPTPPALSMASQDTVLPGERGVLVTVRQVPLGVAVGVVDPVAAGVVLTLEGPSGEDLSARFMVHPLGGASAGPATSVFKVDVPGDLPPGVVVVKVGSRIEHTWRVVPPPEVTSAAVGPEGAGVPITFELTSLEEADLRVEFSADGTTFVPVTWAPSADGPLALGGRRGSVGGVLAWDRVADVGTADADVTLRLVGRSHGVDGPPRLVPVALRGFQRATFAAAADQPAGMAPSSVSTGDVTGDGREDVLVTSHGAATLTVLAGLPDGTLAGAVTFPAGRGPERSVVLDLDGDGVLDAAVCNHDEDSVSVFRRVSRADAPAVTVVHVGTNPYAVAAGDMDGDGAPDLLTVNEQGDSVSMLLNLGGGSFAQVALFPTGTRPRDLALGDVNGDGLLDVAAANFSDDTAGILLGNGLGALGAMTALPRGQFPQAVALDDVNGDGRLDLLVTGFSGVNLSLGHGDGTFADGVLLAAGSRPVHTLVRDLDGDGVPDLAVANSVGNSVSIRLGLGDGTFAPASDVAVGQEPRRVAILDVNQDARWDLVTANAVGESVSVLLGTGTPHVVHAPMEQRFPAMGGGAVMLVDHAGPHRTVLWLDGPMPRVAHGRGGHLVASPVPVDGAQAPGGRWMETAVGILLVQEGASGGVWRLQESGLVQVTTGAVRDVAVGARVLWVLRDGGLSSLWADEGGELVPQADRVAPGALRLVLVDVDGDGDADPVTSDAQGLVSWGEGLSVMQVAAPPVVQLLARDGDGDGRPDVVAVDSARHVLLATQQVDGAFVVTPLGTASRVAWRDGWMLLDAVAGTISVGSSTLDVGTFVDADVRDLDGDGVVDVVVSTQSALRVLTAPPWR